MSTSILVEVSDAGRTVVAEFIPSAEAGYSAGRFLLDLPGGDTIVIRKSVRNNWIEEVVRGRVSIRSVSHKTKKAALNSAAFELLAETIHADSLRC